MLKGVIKFFKLFSIYIFLIYIEGEESKEKGRLDVAIYFWFWTFINVQKGKVKRRLADFFSKK
jgi:hypothetical protein